MNAVYVPGYTLEDQRAGRPMTIAQALDIAELASPNPWSAAHALRTLRQALEQATTTLSEVRDAAGAESSYPFADLPQAVTELRRKAVDAQHTAALRAFANAVMGNWPLDGVYGDELHLSMISRIFEFAVNHGLLALKDPPPTEPCGEHCMCAEYADPKEFSQGVQCYRRTPVLTGGAA